MVSKSSSPETDLLAITTDGNFVAVARYSSRESVGVSLLVATSSFSLAAVLVLLVLMGVAAWSNRSSESKNYFFRSNVATYFTYLLAADLIQAIASIMNARWVRLGGVQQGQFCTVQAVLKQVADVGAAIWSFVVSAQTFCLLFYQLHSPRWVGCVVLGLANGLVVMLALLGPVAYQTKTNGSFYGISGYWCWITPEYDMARMTLGYLTLFLSSFLSFILYTLVFFRLRGNIVVTGWYIRFRTLEKDDSGWRGRQHADSQVLSVAKQMILHPVAYTILFLPIAILRLCEWTGRPVSFPVLMLCDSIFLLAGVVDVVLFCTIRRVVPVKEVAKALFTGRVFRQHADSDTSWCVGSLEIKEDDVPDDLESFQTNDSHLASHQLKFVVVAPPITLPSSVVVPATESWQTARRSLIVDTVHIDPRSPLLRAKSIPRKPLPRELSIYDEYGASRDCHSPIPEKEYPPIPQGYQTGTLTSVAETREHLPPAYCQTMIQTLRSGPISSRNHSGSPDPVLSSPSISSESALTWIHR